MRALLVSRGSLPTHASFLLLYLPLWEDSSMAVRNPAKCQDDGFDADITADNQGMFGQILSMTSFANTVHPESITNPTSRGFLTS